MSKNAFLLKVFIASVFSFSAFADASSAGNDKDYFSIKTVKVEEIDQEIVSDNDYHLRRNDKSFGEVIVIVDGLIAIGERLYPIVEAGKPVLGTNLPVTHVIPRSATNDSADTLYEMENWRSPKSKSWKVTYENFYGMDVISFTYTVHFQYGGSHNGTGRYITGAHISASNVYVAWGFEFDAFTKVVAISNRGSNSNKVAGLTLKLNWTAKSIITEIRSSRTFHLSGNGELRRSY